ncbi:hypothetical protein ACJ6WF_48285 [Streptomyces sp. MMS24-I2-30]|uniref:hypothetical protein n=1 Tax=Streptomyces sp. MMS24-I2-30 TaxID=3351564 RepID=UPI00389684C6
MSTELSGVDLARQALIAAREAAKKNGGTQTKKPKRRTGTVVRRDGRTAASRSGSGACTVVNLSSRSAGCADGVRARRHNEQPDRTARG